MGSPTNPPLSESSASVVEDYNNILLSAAPESESTGITSTVTTEYFYGVQYSIQLSRIPLQIISVTSNYNSLSNNLFLLNSNVMTFVPSLPNAYLVVVYI